MMNLPQTRNGFSAFELFGEKPIFVTVVVHCVICKKKDTILCERFIT